MNFEGPYLAEWFFHSLCPCFDTAVAQSGVISKTKNKFAEIVAATECYLTHSYPMHAISALWKQ